MLAVLMVLAVLPEYQLTEAWTAYDYDSSGDGEHVSVTEAAWVLERRVSLPGGVTGWVYVGYAWEATYTRWDGNDETAAWWQRLDGTSGQAGNIKEAVAALRRCGDGE